VSLRARVLVFLAACVLSALLLPQPWQLLLAVAVYLVIVLPAIPKGPHRE
jgi:hypothetical protein